MKEKCWSRLWVQEPTSLVFPQCQPPSGVKRRWFRQKDFSKYKCSINGGAYDPYLLGGW